jgi:hypothetical protein
VKIPACRRQFAKQMRQVDKALRDKMLYIAFALPLTVHSEQRRA